MIHNSTLPFLLLSIILLGIALFQRYNLWCAALGFVALSLLSVYTQGTSYYAHIMTHQSGIALNIFCLFFGFSLITRYLEESHLLTRILSYLPSGRIGDLALLALTFVLSTVIDNIAAVLIAGSMAATRFDKRLHIFFIAALIVCANAGGAGSIIGDTTTTLLWLSGTPQQQLWPTFLGAIITACLVSFMATIMQNRHHPAATTQKVQQHNIEWTSLLMTALSMVIPVCINIYCSSTHLLDTERLPIFGLSLILCLGLTLIVKKPRHWPSLKKVSAEACFIILLILIAALMPVKHLPYPSILSTYSVGLVSALFDNIPLTALAIEQQHYDWALLAFAVGVGGSILWFGSSAGVALTAEFEESRALKNWWPAIPLVFLAYTAGFICIALYTH